jgi:hypothetical protein
MSSLGDLARESYRNLRHGGPTVVLEALSRGYLTAKPMADDPVYDEDWDLLVVLDACRADLWEAVAADRERFGPAETRVSVGGTSTEWLTETTDDASADALAETAYVTGNPYSAEYVDADDFALVDEVWRYAWDDDLGTIPARPITDGAIRAGRENGDAFDRLIVHYMQPHFPCVPDADTTAGSEGIALDRFGEEPISVWEELRFGQRDPEDVWRAYRANLDYVLDEVELLLDNVDAAAAAVTADHGNAMGERHLYGHVGGVAHPRIREVPWYETTGTDKRTHDPARYERADDAADDDAAVTDRLQALGYAEE